MRPAVVEVKKCLKRHRGIIMRGECGGYKWEIYETLHGYNWVVELIDCDSGSEDDVQEGWCLHKNTARLCAVSVAKIVSGANND